MSAQTGTISFACPQCGRPFSVPSIYAGRKAACKSCGGKIVVPSPVDLAPTGDGPPTPQPGDTVRAVASGELSTEALREQILSDEAIPPAAPARPLRPAPMPPVPETQTPPPYVAAASPVVPESDSSHFARVEEISPAPLDHEPAAVEIAPAVSEPPPERPAPTPQPHPVDSPATMPTTPRLPVRTRRLIADAGQMAGAFTDFRAIRIKSTVGDPPEVYQIEYKIAGLQRGRRANKPKKQNTHLVEIRLTSDYPRLAPQCRMLTPVFHPNIDETTICVGDHWTAGERLVDLVVRIGEMLAYQAYNIKSPLDGEAAMWADLNPERLPTDAQNLRPASRAE